MKVLVTGSSGFVGMHVERRLAAAGHDVVPFDITAGNSILDRDAVDAAVGTEVEAVYHLAAQSDLTKIRSLHEGHHTTQLNIAGTHNLALACARHGARLIYLSTCCVYGNQTTYPVCEDTALPNPIELYAFTKLAGEEIVRGYAANHGLQYVILRSSTTYGPGMRETLVPFVFLNQASHGTDITVHGTGEQTRSLVYITDLVEGIVTVMDRPAGQNKIINLAGAQPISVIKMASDIRRLVNSSSKIVHVADRQHQIFHEYSSIEKALKLLQWQPRTTWAEGLSKTAEWFEQKVSAARRTESTETVAGAGS